MTQPLYRALQLRGTDELTLIKKIQPECSAVDSCFGLVGPHQHSTANNQAQIPTSVTLQLYFVFSLKLQ